MRINTRILCPNSYRSRWSGMASHTLLQHRSAPRKAVRLLPDKRGQLFCVRHFVIFHFYIYKLEFFLPECQLPPNSEGSAELCEATGASLRTQVRIILLCLLTLAPSDGSAATFPVVGDGFFVSHFHIFRFYSYYFLFFVSTHTCPFRQPDG